MTLSVPIILQVHFLATPAAPIIEMFNTVAIWMVLVVVVIITLFGLQFGPQFGPEFKTTYSSHSIS